MRPDVLVGGRAELEAGLEGVTHVLSVGGADPPSALAGGALRVELLDEEDADLLGALPRCCAFLAAAEEDGGTALVCCEAGVSRAPAVVAAWLVKREALGVVEALAAVRFARPSARPNDGFVAQLELWATMGCRLDAWHPAFRAHRLAQLGKRYRDEGHVPEAELFALEDDGEVAPVDEAAAAAAAAVRCRRCRRLVATSRQLVPHDKGPGAGAFTHHQQRSGSGGAAQGGECGSVFVEPLRWMGPLLVSGAVEGKLGCPGCDARLGAFNWSGLQCSCGRWVTPGFVLHSRSVDIDAACGPVAALPVRAAVPRLR